jgi:hypothetical protein
VTLVPMVPDAALLLVDLRLALFATQRRAIVAPIAVNLPLLPLSVALPSTLAVIRQRHALETMLHVRLISARQMATRVGTDCPVRLATAPLETCNVKHSLNPVST